VFREPEEHFSIDALMQSALRPASACKEALQPSSLQVELRRYQKRALAWMLWREKGQKGGDSFRHGATKLHAGWREYRLPSKLPIYQHKEKREVWTLRRHEHPTGTRGGILADEMGLGKTVETIGLILSHPHPSCGTTAGGNGSDDAAMSDDDVTQAYDDGAVDTAAEHEAVDDELDPTKLKVTELREELEKRGLGTEGRKADLVKRLTEELQRGGGAASGSGKKQAPDATALDALDGNPSCAGVRASIVSGAEGSSAGASSDSDGDDEGMPTHCTRASSSSRRNSNERSRRSSHSSRSSNRSARTELATSAAAVEEEGALDPTNLGADGLTEVVNASIKACAQKWYTPDKIRQHSYVEMAQENGRIVIGYCTRARVDGSFDLRFHNGHIEKMVAKQQLTLTTSVDWYDSRSAGGVSFEMVKRALLEAESTTATQSELVSLIPKVLKKMKLSPAEAPPTSPTNSQVGKAIWLGVRQGKLVEKKKPKAYTLSQDELDLVKEEGKKARKGKKGDVEDTSAEKGKRKSNAGGSGKKKKRKQKAGQDCEEAADESGSKDEQQGMKHRRLPAIKTTLIVMPVTLLDQWEAEITKHTEGALKVLQYYGTVKTRPSTIPLRSKDQWSMRRELGYGYNMSADEQAGLLAAVQQDKKRFTKEMAAYEEALKKEKKTLEREASEYSPPDFGSYDVVITSYDAIEADLLLLPVREEKRIAELRRVAKHYNNKKDLAEVEKETQVELPPTPLLDQQWWRIVLDEAQEIEAQGSRDEYGSSRLGAERLSERLCQLATVNSWVISGTPVGQKIEELGKYLDFIDCPVYGNRLKLRQVAFEEYTARRKEGLQMVHGMLRDHCWRETKARVKDESNLPVVTECILTVELAPEDRRWYTQAERLCVQALRRMITKHKQNLREAAEHGDNSVEMALPARFPELFATLRLRCCHPQLSTSEDEGVACFQRRQAAANAAEANAKASAGSSVAHTGGSSGASSVAKSTGGGLMSSKLSALTQLIKEARSQNSTAKFVVFSQWIPLLVQTQQALHEVLPHPQGAGSVLLRVGKAGSDAIACFRDDPLCAVMCVCTRAGFGSAGLNLTNAQHVVLLEPSMDVGMEAQAVGRVHRLGQVSEVTVHRLYAPDTIESHVNKLQERRRNLYEVNERDGVGELITDANTW
jgi:SNF2 family DNA or RNA helicase